MNFRSLNLPQLWGVLSRTRPINSAKNEYLNRTQKMSNQKNGKNLIHLIYDGLGTSIPLALCYVVGIIVEDVRGGYFSFTLLLAVVTSLLTGLCYTELITSDSQSSGNLITATYQLVGEFPAYFIGVCYVMVLCSGFGALAKALSSTIDELLHGKMSNFLSHTFGLLPVTKLPPDFLAAGIIVFVAVLLACGLKQSRIFRSTMNVFSLMGFILFLAIGSFHIQSDSPRVVKPPPHIREIFGSAGICCSLFFQFIELGRRSKQYKRTNLPLAIGVTQMTILVSTFILGFLLSIMMDNRYPLSGAPLLRALQLRDIDWARFAIGSIQVIILGLALNEAGEEISRQLVSLSSNGFASSTLSQECSVSFTHSKAHLYGGIWTATIVIFMTNVFILEFLAMNVLMINILLSMVALYRPHRCAHQSLLCTLAVTPSSRNFARSNKSERQKIVLNFLKKGLKHKSKPKRNIDLIGEEDEEEFGVPLLTSLHSSSDNPSELTHSLDTNEDNFDEGKLVLNGDFRADKEEVVSDARNPQQIMEKSNDISESDVFIEEDIDSIVAEFKQQLRVSTSGTKIKVSPTQISARKAFILVITMTLLNFISSCLSLLLCNRYNNGLSFYSCSIIITLIVALNITAFSLLIILWRLPSYVKLRKVLPFSPLSAFVTLSLNVLLATELLSRTAWIVLPIHVSGWLWYIFFASRHSIASKLNYDGTLFSHKPSIHHEMVNMIPIVTTSLCQIQPMQHQSNVKT